MKARVLVLLALALAGCGDDDGGGSTGGDGGPSLEPSVLGETIARDTYRQYRKSSDVGDCRERGTRKFECVAREEGGAQVLMTVTVEDGGRYRAVSSATGAVVTGTYPRDPDFRAVDLAGLMREAVAAGKRARAMPADARPAEEACELNQQQDRTYDCYLPSPKPGARTRPVVVGADGRFRVLDPQGDVIPFSGRLPDSFR